MNTVKRILAVIGILFLLALYLITLICAVTDNSGTMQFFFASVVATVIIPVLLWTYSFIYRLLKEHYGPDSRKESADIRADSADMEQTKEDA